jgi:hypothetical protein
MRALISRSTWDEGTKNGIPGKIFGDRRRTSPTGAA